MPYETLTTVLVGVIILSINGVIVFFAIGVAFLTSASDQKGANKKARKFLIRAAICFVLFLISGFSIAIIDSSRLHPRSCYYDDPGNGLATIYNRRAEYRKGYELWQQDYPERANNVTQIIPIYKTMGGFLYSTPTVEHLLVHYRIPSMEEKVGEG